MQKRSGWLFDVYEHPAKGVVLWLAGEDGKPHSFHQEFETVFYARGSAGQLRAVGEFIRKKHAREVVRLERVTTREDLFDGPQVVMGIGTSNAVVFRKLTRDVQEEFPDLLFYDVDIPLTVRYAAANNVFMMARCEVAAQADGKLISIRALDTIEEPDPQLPKLRLLSLKADTDPSHRTPNHVVAKFGRSYLRLPFDQPRELLGILNGVLSAFDPDVIHTCFGDGDLFPRLFRLSKETGIPFNPNRDLSMPVVLRKAVKFRNYGRPHYRAPQVHLRGRWHIDIENCMTYKQYGLVGAIEQTRLGSLPLQEVARRSPGASISAMQMLTALKRGTLVPYQHQKAEIAKNFNQYYKAARGGLTLQPPLGIFQTVGLVDFSSKMASIIIKYNVSPETVVDIKDEREGFEIPELGVKVLSRPGLIPQTLQPMRDKRLALKKFLKSLNKNDPGYYETLRRYKAVERFQNYNSIVEALKWLAVVCYGRLRFANSVFGRINSHEVVSHLSRKAILHARRIAEGTGFVVVHLYVDSLFVWRPDAARDDFQTLAGRIEEQTGLPMDLENVYSWFAFLASRENPNISVSNKFYGVAENGKHKLRGIAERRGDTCAFVADLQREIVNILAKEKDSARLVHSLPEILQMTQARLSSLTRKEIPLEELVVKQTLSRELNGYSVLSPAAVAARQLQAQGITRNSGQHVRFIYMAPGPGVHAWGLPSLPNPRHIDVPKYRELALRAVHEVLEPIGITESTLKGWLFHGAGYVAPVNLHDPSRRRTRQELPLFGDLNHFRGGS